jgi:hypothetical protein
LLFSIDQTLFAARAMNLFAGVVALCVVASAFAFAPAAKFGISRVSDGGYFGQSLLLLLWRRGHQQKASQLWQTL